MSRRTEPCLCGDPECPRCFPGNLYPRDEGDMIDDAYERATQEKVDDAAEARRRKFYLGDSVYAQCDGHMVTLTTENGLPGDPSNTIHLEPGVVTSLYAYLRRIGWSAP